MVQETVGVCVTNYIFYLEQPCVSVSVCMGWRGGGGGGLIVLIGEWVFALVFMKHHVFTP